MTETQAKDLIADLRTEIAENDKTIISQAEHIAGIKNFLGDIGLAIEWIGENYPKVLVAMPTEHFATLSLAHVFVKATEK